MVEMASFSLPPTNRRGRERGSSSEETGSKGHDGVKSFMSGIMLPFTACLQPDTSACVPQCGTGYHIRYPPAKPPNPAVVSPLMDRMNPQKYDIPTSPITSRYSTNLASPAEEGEEVALSSTEIEKPHSNDVLCGRGGSSNRHKGNMHFRELVAANKKMYVGLTKKQKMLVARKIVEMVHSTEPPGRFLAKNMDSGLWYDIGLPRSLEKTSQALREKNSNDYPSDQRTEVSDIMSDVSQPYSAVSRSDAGSSTIADDDRSVISRISVNKSTAKNVEAPPLIIPNHLMDVFGPKPTHDSKQRAWPDYSPSRHLEQPHLHKYSAPFSSPPRDQPYPVPPRPHIPPRSPLGYPGGLPPQHPYSIFSPHPEELSPAQDHREHYDYYTHHHSDCRDRYDHRALPPPGPPPRARYHLYPPPPPYRHHRGPPPHARPHMHNPMAPPSPSGEHYRRHGHPPIYEYPHPTEAVSPTCASPAPSPMQIPVIVKSPNNGYIRSKSEVSPERRQEWKRQRNERGVPKRLNSADASSLTFAVENSLTLEERVVGKERGTAEPSSLQLMSPSGALQGRSRPRPQAERSTVSSSEASLTEKEGEAVSALSALAALSTAAFLNLDGAG